MINIKFRGKRVDNGEWVYGYYFDFFDIGKQRGFILTLAMIGEEDREEKIELMKIEVEPETVGMLVGVKDKNGEEYYHGDIFRIDYWDPKIHEIVYDRGGFCFRHSKDDTYYSDIKYAEDGVKIGNVFDNPSLLK